MKWNQAHLLCLDIDDPVIRKSALAWKNRYSIPRERCYSHPPPPIGDDDFRTLYQDSLTQVRPSDKLMIFGHGARRPIGRRIPDRVIMSPGARAVAGYDAYALAKLLKENGLQHAGLIAFKACLVGNGNYLEHFRNACTQQGIQIGWYIGYKGTTATMGESEVVTKTDLWMETFGLRKFGLKSKDEKRVKVVKGNVHTPDAYLPLEDSERYVA